MTYEMFQKHLAPYLAEAEENGWPTTGRIAFANMKAYIETLPLREQWRGRKAS